VEAAALAKTHIFHCSTWCCLLFSTDCGTHL